MWQSLTSWNANQVESQRKQWAAKGIPFDDLLPASRVNAVLREEHVVWRERIYTPLVTLWTFLSQVLSPDHCCREAVAQLRAYLTRAGRKPCSPDDSPYCQARRRLPEGVCARLMREVGRDAHQRVTHDGRLGGRRVKIVDGATLSMPDTPPNQAVYPQPSSQKRGLGFPLMRMVAVMSLASAVVLDAALGPYAGKGTGETSLFRQIWDSLLAGEIVVGDRYFASFWDLALLSQRGVDSVFRQQDLHWDKARRIRRLGVGDWLLELPKPPRPDWLDPATYDQISETLVVRQVTVRIPQRGFRVRQLTLVTTLCDASQFSAAELAQVYRARWNIELDLRSIKCTMQMDVLRCKTPEMVRKEVWMHLLAYNLIRTVMAEAAARRRIPPRTISFQGALQTLLAFRPLIEGAHASQLPKLYDNLLAAIAHHRVGDRPNRFEPRAIKRRPKPHDLLLIPRSEARKHLLC